ncbi:MAG: hypothetical protein U1F64_13840 [Burkholderiales bacterium]
MYNHIVEPKMLLWLISAAGVKASDVGAAERAAKGATSLPAQSAAIRKHVPWSAVDLCPTGVKEGAKII